MFDPDAYLASKPPRDDANAASSATIDFTPDTAADPELASTEGWQLVPATVMDRQGFTLQEYEEAAEGFAAEGNHELATQATHRAWKMRNWLVTVQGAGWRN